VPVTPMFRKLILLGIAVVVASISHTRAQTDSTTASSDTAGATVDTQTNMPNITINADLLQSSVVFRREQFKPTDCAIVEGCVSGSGKRNLMKFDEQTPNIGTADLYLGNPTNNPAFVYSPCHGHYHLEGYAVYELLNLDETPVILNGVLVVGHKQ